MTELTRRQMRELERAGQAVEVPLAPVLTSEKPAAQIVPAPAQPQPSITLPQSDSPVLTRRQLRELAERSQPAEVQELEPVVEQQAVASPVTSVIAQAISEVAAEEAEELSANSREAEPVRLEAEQPRRRVLPPVGSRREFRSEAPVAAEPISLEAPIVEIPEDGFRGANYLGEPSTQSIMLEIAPEAIALPIETGEILTTGSIAILPEVPSAATGGFDGPELDVTEDAVTGVLSVVDPVSAQALIDERSGFGVVPEGVLRKGWWRPWLVGVISIAMAIAAILASITILNALGE